MLLQNRVRTLCGYHANPAPQTTCCCSEGHHVFVCIQIEAWQSYLRNISCNWLSALVYGNKFIESLFICYKWRVIHDTKRIILYVATQRRAACYTICRRTSRRRSKANTHPHYYNLSGHKNDEVVPCTHKHVYIYLIMIPKWPRIYVLFFQIVQNKAILSKMAVRQAKHATGARVHMQGQQTTQQHATTLFIIYRDIKMMKSCHVHINMCIYIFDYDSKVAAYICFILSNRTK